MKLYFFKDFSSSSFKISYLHKSFLVISSYLPKLKGCLWLISGAYFQYNFQWKFSLHNKLSIDQVLKTLNNLCFWIPVWIDQWWRNKLRDFLQTGSSILQWPRVEKKRERGKYKNLNVSRTKISREFFR